jgi:hypothetical protein
MKKNGCPMAFLWSGQGMGLFLTLLSSIGVIFLILAKLIFHSLGQPLNLKPYLALALALFFVGKIFPKVKSCFKHQFTRRNQKRGRECILDIHDRPNEDFNNVN